MIFTDIIYGKIELPDWVIPFLKIPEFVRLRGVRLSNIDSFQFKDFNGPARWEHCIGVMHLATRFADRKSLDFRSRVHLMLAALLHDVATPPFAHTIEYVLDGYDHELESSKILSADESDDSNPGFPVFASQLPQFRNLCKIVSKKIGVHIDPDEVAQLVIGQGELGYVINGTIDLDNIDNVIRASMFLGVDIDKSTPYKLVDWLAKNGIATDIKNEEESCVKTWLKYRTQMYSAFFNASDEEIGREAFLQHIIRRGYNEGISRKSIIWSTDEALLSTIENYRNYSIAERDIEYSIVIRELVERYRLMESVYRCIEIPIHNEDTLKLLKNPLFADWLERELSTKTFEPFVMVASRRYEEKAQLFPTSLGSVIIFKLGSPSIKLEQLPINTQNDPIMKLNSTVEKNLANILTKKINESVTSKPWQTLSKKRKENIISNLENVGNWSFRLSRNESLHSYPATFVHAIPSTLISVLGLTGELIIDPFGGTAQTAVEAIKLGCKAITSDSNSIANLIASTKLTYLSKEQRLKVLTITTKGLKKVRIGTKPKFDLIEKWHHPDTLSELCRIKTYINEESDSNIKQFLILCFSDIITSCTARKGKENSYFADNTPLQKDLMTPPYENALEHFVNKIKKNVDVLEKQYSLLGRNGRNIQEEMSNGKVCKLDATKMSPATLGIEPNSAAAVITSPPYLCMVDYTLGQRLSYYWLFPDEFENDYKEEIAARRGRSNPDKSMIKYLSDMRLFARNSASVLRKGGFLATVIGAPVATAFQDKDILLNLDKIFAEEGFELLWENQRPIQWHRNHGYAKLNEERVAVHVYKG